MKKKFLGRVLTMLLVASMVFTLLPASAIAAGNWWWNADEYTEEAAPTATADNYSRILHLDCGRKYFSKDWIIALLHEMQDAGYNQLELAFGNDGLRFLLKDMTFVANGTTYDHDTIVKKVEAGNKLQNSSNDSRWLTEAEMDEIIAAANGLGIEIVPLLNLPGHANTILDIADDTLNASGSNNTLDVANSEAARNFGTAIFEKYLEYFNGKGCHYFCFGADEYANDAGTPFSFSRLNTVQYANFASFINTLSEKIDAKGMTPRAFNDGLYYDHGAWDMNTSVNNNIPKIQCCYWSSGWGDYPVASASTIAQKGHKMINTHGDWYYVTKYNKYGQEEIQIPSDSAIRGFSNTAFSGSKINNPVGSMFCIWCDAPAIRTEQEIAGNIRLLLRKMAARMQDKSIDTINTGIVTGGFNEDGSLNTTPVQPDTGITIKPEGGTTGTTGAPKLDIANPETLKLTASEKVLWRWNSEVVNLTSADPAEEISTIDAYALQELEAKSVFVTPIAAGDPMVEVTTLGENPTTTKYPIEVVNSAAPADVTVDLKVGQTSDPYTVDGNVTDTDMNLASNFKDVASYKLTPKPATGETVVTKPVGERFYIRNSSNKYFTENSSWIDNVNQATTWTAIELYNTNQFSLALESNTAKRIVCYSKDNWSVRSDYSGYDYKFYVNESGEIASTKTYPGSGEIVLGTPVKISTGSSTAYTDITFTGKAEGTTYVTIGGTRYTIKVSYYEQPVNVVLNKSTQVAVSGALNADGLNTAVAEVSISTDGTTMTVTGKAKGETSVIVGNTKYLITVSTENLETVPPLKIEYWITNSPVQRSENDTTNYFTVSAAMNGIATPNGVEVTADTMIPKDGYRDGRTVDYWQCRLLDTSIENDYGDGTQAQTETNGDDETTSGFAFTKVRYYGGHWAVCTEKNEWVEVKSNHQLVAYFLEIITIDNINGTRELYVNAADWGNIGSKNGSFGYPVPKICAVAVQTVYEDGATNPEKTDIDSIQTKMLVYGLSTKRGLGTMRFTGENGNKIYKVTAETGTMQNTAGESYSIREVTYHNNEADVWTGELSAAVSISNPTNNPTLEGNKQNLYWSTTRNDFILIRVYIKAPATKDSLTVHYMDETTGTASEFYNYSINVVKDTVFDQNFGVTNGVLHDNTVVNYYGQPQTVKTDLKEMPEIDATYRFAAYQCERTMRSDNGKEVYLYYKFTRNAAFVADFGLSITIPFAQINGDLDVANITDVTVTTQQYGTVTSNVGAKTITYTPNKTFGEDIESLNVTFSGRNLANDEQSISYQVYIYPASNVLYEASFLTQGTETTNNWVTRYGWNATPFGDEVQQTQKLDTPQIFGFDPAYQNVTTEKGFWKASGLKAAADGTKSLTTSFYGNAIDVIGSCGPNTGRVMVTIKDAVTGNPVKSVLVETTYSAGDIAQVPLAHIELDAEKSYTAVIYGYAPRASAAKQQSARAPMLAASYYSDDSYDALTADLAAMGLNLSDVEVISAADAAAKTASVRRAPQAYALNTVDEGTTDGATVTIDGFRVYRSASNDAYNKLGNEYDVTYRNILDVMDGQVITAYVDNNVVTGCEVSNYEKSGGPQDEIYLAQNQTIAFKLMKADGTAAAGQGIQISLSAVSGAPKYNGEPISSTMEMYYTFPVNDEGVVSITNNGNGLLAIGNVKVPAGYTTAAPDSIAEETLVRSIRMALNAAPETPDTVFEPTISAKATTTRFIRSKVVTLTVSASADVAKLTVNGKELRPTNGWLVSMGWSKSYNYILTETVKKSETKAYEIIGYSADGTASTPTIVNSK